MTHVLPMPSTSDPVDRLAALFDAHYGRLYRLARRLVPQRDDALDLVQETFLKAASSPNAVPFGARDEEAWLVRVLVNIRRDQWRHAAVCNRFHRNTNASSRDCDPEPSMIAHATVWKALDLLSPRRRAIIVLCELEDLEIPSIAALLGISAITVRWHLSRGRRELALSIKSSVIQNGGDVK